MSLRKAINDKCRDCIFDECAPGTWKQQVTLCSVQLCPLWPVRPRTASAPPESVLHQYGVKLADFQEMARK